LRNAFFYDFREAIDMIIADGQRQEIGLTLLSKTDKNGDKWVPELAKGQSPSSLKNSSDKSGPPLLIKTDVQISVRDVSIGLVVEGQAGEKYVG
jgi:hypothetical protein